MNRRDFLKSAAALAGSVALPAPVAVAVEQLEYAEFSGWSFRGHSEKPRVIDYVEPDRLIYKGTRGKGNVPVFYEPAREYLGVL